VKINVAQLRKSEGSTERFQFSEIPTPIEMGKEKLVFQTPLNVQIDLINTGKSLLVNGQANTIIAVNCSRCLKEFPYNLDFKFEDEWIPAEHSSLDEEGTALIFEKDEFSIDERILEHLLLQLPMRFICSPDCKGLCSKCGVDRNNTECDCTSVDIDPRMERLSKWNKGV